MPLLFWFFIIASSCFVTGVLCYLAGQSSRKYAALSCLRCPVLNRARHYVWHNRDEHARLQLVNAIQDALEEYK